MYFEEFTLVWRTFLQFYTKIIVSGTTKAIGAFHLTENFTNYNREEVYFLNDVWPIVESEEC